MIITRCGYTRCGYTRCGYTRYGTKDDTSFLVQDLQAKAYDVQSVQELFTSFIKVFGYLVGTPREQAGGEGDGWTRGRVVIDNGSV